MQVYLPIAEMSVPAESIFLVSAFVGLLSGIFGIGGGFLATPFLIFTGVPPVIAVGTQASQLVASSIAGVLGHWEKGNVDVKIGCVMLAGGMVGSVVGILIFGILEKLGQIDFAISILYIILLGFIGVLMLAESFTHLVKPKNMRKEFNTLNMNSFIAGLPYKMRFPRSKLYISALVPGGIGFIGGVLASILGVGGSFIMVPAMIYILGIPSLLVAGTVLFQMIFTTAFATIMHALVNQTVDVVLAVILIIGGVAGAQLGITFARHVKGIYARVTLALIVLAVCLQMIGNLFIQPHEIFSTVALS
ncbi:MAG: sulfite exporter TauE/SafE family protein [Alphaproteobacteria bacterium PRO2]|nr:sulfite exporter TauE/SafE family protein [Alphaproteobacteria bacterium PRO2]